MLSEVCTNPQTNRKDGAPDPCAPMEERPRIPAPPSTQSRLYIRLELNARAKARAFRSSSLFLKRRYSTRDRKTGSRINWWAGWNFKKQSNQQQLPEKRSFRWIPRSFDRIPRSFDGIPRSFDGIPSSFDRIPRSLDGIPRSFQRTLRSFDGIPRSFDGIPRSFDGIYIGWPSRLGQPGTAV